MELSTWRAFVEYLMKCKAVWREHHMVYLTVLKYEFKPHPRAKNFDLLVIGNLILAFVHVKFFRCVDSCNEIWCCLITIEEVSACDRSDSGRNVKSWREAQVKKSGSIYEDVRDRSDGLTKVAGSLLFRNYQDLLSWEVFKAVHQWCCLKFPSIRAKPFGEERLNHEMSTSVAWRSRSHQSTLKS